ncbi:hypothetical protein Tco_0940608 [Tanacetum coccineum]|uniref:DUF4283 domain-containing protein n=1 Tax=Tanacetum coccineum TaxID=301880 RepID=A0ABQ5DQ79_9ASTR
MMEESSCSEGWWAYFSSSEGASPSPSSSGAAPHGENHASISVERAAILGHPAYEPDERYGNILYLYPENTKRSFGHVHDSHVHDSHVHEWRPPRCDICKIFGHVHDHCPKKVMSHHIVATSNVVNPIVEKTNDGFQTVGKKKKKKATTSAPKKGATHVSNASRSSSMLKTTSSASKNDNIATSNSYSALYDEEDVENVRSRHQNPEAGQNTSLGRDGKIFSCTNQKHFTGLVIKEGYNFNHFDQRADNEGVPEKHYATRYTQGHTNKRQGMIINVLEYEQYIHAGFGPHIFHPKEFKTFDVLGFWKALGKISYSYSIPAWMDILSVKLLSVDHLDAQERKQDTSPLELPLDVEEGVFNVEVQQNEATQLTDQKIALDASSDALQEKHDKINDGARPKMKRPNRRWT